VFLCTQKPPPWWWWWKEANVAQWAGLASYEGARVTSKVLAFQFPVETLTWFLYGMRFVL
jgi:hypothetical protein